MKLSFGSDISFDKFQKAPWPAKTDTFDQLEILCLAPAFRVGVFQCGSEAHSFDGLRASPAMVRRSLGAGSVYWLGLRDKSGAYLDGGKRYKLTVPQPVPQKLFWSVTVYDTETRSQVLTDQGKAALRSLFELKDVSTSQPTELYFAPQAPAGKEKAWIKTIPGKGWFVYFRVYGPEQAAFDGSWKPGDFERMD